MNRQDHLFYVGEGVGHKRHAVEPGNGVPRCCHRGRFALPMIHAELSSEARGPPLCSRERCEDLFVWRFNGFSLAFARPNPVTCHSLHGDAIGRAIIKCCPANRLHQITTGRAISLPLIQKKKEKGVPGT